MGMMRCRDGWVQLVGVTPAQWDALAASPDAGELGRPGDRDRRPHAPRTWNVPPPRSQTWCEQRDRADVVRILAPLGCPVGAYATPADLLVVGATRAPGLLPRSRRRPRRADARSWSSVPLLRDPGGDPIGAGTRQHGRVRRRTRRQASTCRAGAGSKACGSSTSRGPPPARTRPVCSRCSARRSSRSSPRNVPIRRGEAFSPTTAASTVRRTSTSSTSTSGRSRSTCPSPRASRSPTASPSGPTSSSTTSAPASWPGSVSTPSALLAERPELIVVSSSANGATGPEAMAAGLASIFGATGGLSEQTGYADGPPTEIGESTDYRSGAALAVAVLAALLHRAAHRRGPTRRSGVTRGRRRQLARRAPRRTARVFRGRSASATGTASSRRTTSTAPRARTTGSPSRSATNPSGPPCARCSAATTGWRGIRPRRARRAAARRDRRRDRGMDRGRGRRAKRSRRSRPRACRRWR